MSWYYHLNGENKGPVEVSELQALKARNVISPETLVWTEGMESWSAYRTTPALAPTVTSAAAPPSVSTGIAAPEARTQICAQCFQIFPETEMLRYENSWVCPACKPLFFQRIKEGVRPAGELVYASVGIRFLAIVIDGLILVAAYSVIIVPFLVLLGSTVKEGEKPDDLPPWAAVTVLVLMLGFYLVPILYEIIFIGKYGATWGKMAMGLKVVRPDGGRVSYGQATGRYFAKILSGMILYIGFLMPFWDNPQRRALHDHICNTRVTTRRA